MVLTNASDRIKIVQVRRFRQMAPEQQKSARESQRAALDGGASSGRPNVTDLGHEAGPRGARQSRRAFSACSPSKARPIVLQKRRCNPPFRTSIPPPCCGRSLLFLRPHRASGPASLIALASQTQTKGPACANTPGLVTESTCVTCLIARQVLPSSLVSGTGSLTSSSGGAYVSIPDGFRMSLASTMAHEQRAA